MNNARWRRFRYELSAKAVLAGCAGGAAALAVVSLVAALLPEHTPRSESELKVGLGASIPGHGSQASAGFVRMACRLLAEGASASP